MISLLDSAMAGEEALAPQPGAESARVLILGIGNVLMGDEGVGVHVLRRLEREALLPGVRLLDGGTGGVNLLGEFGGAEVVILVDATRDGSPAGTVRQRRIDRVVDLPRGLGAHDFGLKDLFAAAALVGRLPDVHLFTIAVETVRPMCMELSAAVAASVPETVRSVRRLAQGLAPGKA